MNIQEKALTGAGSLLFSAISYMTTIPDIVAVLSGLAGVVFSVMAALAKWSEYKKNMAEAKRIEDEATEHHEDA